MCVIRSLSFFYKFSTNVVVTVQNTPNQKYELMDNGEYIIYDGVYEDGKINE